MKKIIILFLTILLIGCSKNDPVQPLEDKTYFNGSVNNESWESDGLAFLREDSSLHIRGFLGSEGFHHQIDIVLKNNTPGTFLLDSSVLSSSGSEVVGMDAIAASYIPQELSYITVEFDTDNKHISGEMKFFGFSNSYNRGISVSSNFYIKIGLGYRKWTCDFNGDGINNCRFIE